MSDEDEFIGFLGLPRNNGPADIVVLQLPYELTTSYGNGTANGPHACVKASTQVELFDELLEDDLPGNLNIQTPEPWEARAGTLVGQLDEIVDYAAPYFNGQVFPLFLGGEHGILPPIIEAAKHHPLIEGDLSKLTIVQIDAHADLRDELDGEMFSHACAASRSMDMGVGRLLQIGIRAYSKQELKCIHEDSRISTFFARDTQHPCDGQVHWNTWLEKIRSIEGPIHLTIDIDGLDGSLVPSTGTPVPGGLTYWQVVQTIETLFTSPTISVISADVNEIVPQSYHPLTEFTAAMLATRIIGGHSFARKSGFWSPQEQNANFHKNISQSSFFATWRTS